MNHRIFERKLRPHSRETIPLRVSAMYTLKSFLLFSREEQRLFNLLEVLLSNKYPFKSSHVIKEITIQLFSLMVLSKFSFLFFFVVFGWQNKKKVMNPDIHLNKVGFLFYVLMKTNSERLNKSFVTLTTNEVRLPAELKHINKRRKRN